MRRLALALVATLAMAAPAAAQQVRNLASNNGWVAYTAQSNAGPLCGMGTEANSVGRFFWIKVERLRGNLHGFIQVGDRSWNVRQEAQGRIVVGIDRQRAELNYTGTSRPDMVEASYRGAFENFLNFVRAFALGNRMQVSFPGEDVSPWGANLRGTRAVTEAFLNCARRM
ncbi:hypothetical protein GXW78_16080 [Roseomonas terrae]|uniref:Uncharacterized protein n=1 Tax=Neoroseomonas terrae TaxID=424799 RepID=A0ABS5EJI9_9PROT|nr:hypothetical protein [Neoroseomonas terrae]MBR0651190.1 hypothetical protein [Neoroseomonas terrae]